jgi:hypothetical protein
MMGRVQCTCGISEKQIASDISVYFTLFHHYLSVFLLQSFALGPSVLHSVQLVSKTFAINSSPLFCGFCCQKSSSFEVEGSEGRIRRVERQLGVQAL